jgi:hypothetical protein
MESTQLTTYYASILSWAFLATNSMRVIAYLPTIRKLLHPQTTADGQSQLSWLLWAASNVTLSLHSFETNNRQLNEVILIAGANALMCCICFFLVRGAQQRAGRLQHAT